jgi:uncharacterized protein YjbJ (UPF0337 family)
MGALKDKLKGGANIGAGRIKQGLARDTRDRRLDAEGASQETRGRVRKTVGDVKEAAGNAVHSIASRIKRSRV